MATYLLGGDLDTRDGAESGLGRRAVDPIKTLGQRAHRATGRTMIYVACSVVDGTARVADDEELAEAEWCDRATLAEYVPDPFFEPVQEYLDAALI